jgi:hypothetical protein
VGVRYPLLSAGADTQPSATLGVWRVALKDLREIILRELNTKIMIKTLYLNAELSICSVKAERYGARECL